MDERDKALAKRALKYHQHSWHELNYDEVRNKPYLIGKKKESDESRFVYVMDPNKKFRFNFLKKIVTDTGCSSVLLNIHGSDSSSVYYKLHAGLVDLNDESIENSNRSNDEISDEDSGEEEGISNEDSSEEESISDENSSEEESISDENSSEEDGISDQDSSLESSEKGTSEESSDSDSCKEVLNKPPSPQIITISD